MKKTDYTICKFYKLISREKLSKKRKDEKHMCYLKVIKQYTCLVKRKKTLTELSKLKHNNVLNTRDRAYIMKIIPTWSKASLPRFHQTALLDRTAILKSRLVKPW